MFQEINRLELSSMRIGLVSKFDAADGLCVRANHVLKGLVKRNHEVHVFTQSDKVEHLPQECIHKIPAVHLNPHFSLDSPSAVRMIAKECLRHRIDVLHVQMNSGSTEFMLPLFKKSLPPLVVTFHLAYASGSLLYRTLFGIAWKASLFACNKYDEIVLVDPSQKLYFLKSGFNEDRISIIRNGVDIDLFTPRLVETKDNNVIDFVFVGRLSYDKGVDILLEAFCEYHSENSKSRLTLIGDGMLKHQLADYSENGSIRWLGAIEHHQIPKILQKTDVFVIPQNIGGLGLSVIEAMSCGLPVITTAIGETKRLLGSNEGILVEPNSTDAVLDAMRTLADNESLRHSMGKSCRKKVQRDYAWISQIEQLEKSYQKAIDNPMH